MVVTPSCWRIRKKIVVVRKSGSRNMHLFSPQFLADRAGVGEATEPTGLHRAFPNSAERLRLAIALRTPKRNQLHKNIVQ